MTLAPGTRLGPYLVVDKLGEGGMGEVYKARDARLERTVAIKVLPPTLAADPGFRARFDREAKSISALNHPHICTLHDVGEVEGTAFLVMEHLEGETLADRLRKGPLPVDLSLAIASQIADALDKAHRHGIVHRDLKPGNIFLVRAAGASGAPHVKLLDFGLAKTGVAAVSGSFETQLATLTQPGAPLTARGTILGTFQYMAPEQIEGRDADARADIWAFGCVLYEMLTGRRAFEGRTQASLIASILERQPPPMAELQPLTPPALGRIVRTCLEKDPDNRFHTAHDLWLHLQWIEEGGSAAGLAAPIVTTRRRRARAFVAGAIGLTALLSGGAAWWLKPEPESSGVVGRFVIPLVDHHFTRGGRRLVAISPDGSRIAYIADRQIYLRRLHEAEAQAVRGTDVDPFDLTFSPDGEWLAFSTPSPATGTLDGGALKKISVAGGAPIQLCSVSAPFGLRWTGTTLLFSVGRQIQTVSDAGGTPQTLVSVAGDSNELLAQPQLLNDGRDLIYTVLQLPGRSLENATIVVQAVSGGARRVLVAGGSDGRMLPGGQLLYVRDSVLYGLSVDPRGLEPRGGPVALVENVRGGPASGVGQFDVAVNGTLVFAPQVARGVGLNLVWVDRQGREEVIPAPDRTYYVPSISPDGTRVAVSTVGPSEADIWIWDDQRGTETRLTSDAREENYPVWSKDGRYIFYRANPEGQFDIFRRPADGTGQPERLTATPESETPVSLLPDGQSLLIRVGASVSDPRSRLARLPFVGDVKPVPILSDTSGQSLGEISPDGRWILYQSDESSTQEEIWVRPYPNTEGGRWKISTNGGERPVWSRSGREIFYREQVGPRGDDSDRLMSVTVSPVPAGAAFSYGTPTPLFDVSRYSFLSIARTYDVSADGSRFLFFREPARTAGPDSLTVIVNWTAGLSAQLAGR